MRRQISRSLIGRQLASRKVVVETTPLRHFLSAIGEDDLLYHDSSIAVERGYPGIPVPPTYAYCLASMAEDGIPEIYLLLDVDPARILHATQRFEFSGSIIVGDEVIFESAIVDIFDRKAGALVFVTVRTGISTNRAGHVGSMDATLVVRMEG